ncbi:MAG: hypothetical protein HDS32_05405 [Bacteroides sp.]|nr:hypothetical protein [Bacteroides sp.]
METNNDILTKAGRTTGYTVPDGYFDSVRNRIMDNLPEYIDEQPQKLSVWKRIQPYIYMAAMFAGIWCMMKMFHMMTSNDLSLDNPPETVALAMADSDSSEWIYMQHDNSDIFMLEDDICNEYSSIEEFKNDFNN